MVIKTKSELKDRFKTGDKPTQQDFADVIDSSVSTINGEKPDSNGNIVLQTSTGNDLSGVEADITALKSTTTQQTTDIETLQTTTTQQTTDITDLQTNLETITKDYPNAKAQIEHNRRNVEGVTNTVLGLETKVNQNTSDIALIIKELNLNNGDEPTALTALTTIVTQLQQAVADLQNGTTPETTTPETTPEEPTE